MTAPNIPGQPHIAYQGSNLCMEGVKLSDVAKQMGTPVFAYSKASMLSALAAYQRGFEGRKVQICYAMKANSNLAVLQVFAKAGCGFDIVSAGELARVLAAGGEPSKIIFSGVGKTRAEMKQALELSIGCFNVESEAELEVLNEVALSLGKKAPVSLRVNPNVDPKTHPYISTGLKGNKFGVAHESALQTYQRAAQLKGVSVVGIVFCTVLGTLIGVGRVSHNALARGLGYAYTELFRNVPVLLQLLIWYVLLVEFMPDSQNPLHFNDWFYLSKNGISFPVPVWDPSVHALVWDVPLWLDGEITQGISLTPEFLAITLGLSFYTSAFVAEVVRAGIVSVPRGQLEAAKSIGLSNWQTTRQVLLPQAMRVIIPPLTNQYLNLTKNSSLAVAIGYPDLVSISNTALNQTGRAVECIALIMAVYLCLSLGTSALMNVFNQRMAIRER